MDVVDTRQRTRIPALLVVACLGGALSGLDTAVNIAFPAITAAFSLDVADISWVVVSYVLTYAALLLPLGRLADARGHARVLVAGLALSAVALAVCGLAPNFGVFLGGRVAQGLGIALVLAGAPAMVTLAVDESSRARALGWFQMAVALGLAAGPPVGGLLIGWVSWRSVYLFRVPVAAVLVVLAVLAGGLARPAREPGVVPSWRDLDLAGALTLAGGLACLLFAASRGASWGWTAGSTLTVAAIGVVGCAAFVAVERRVRRPLVDLGLFRVPAFAAANVLNALANATMFAIWLLGPYLLVDVQGNGPLAGGLLLASAPVATAVAAAVAGRVVARVGAGRLSVIGLLVESLGLVATSRLGPGSPPLAVVGSFALVGLGLGLFQVPNMSFVMGSIPRSQQGVAGGMSQMMRTVGIVSGVAAANALFVVLRDAELGRGAASPVAAFPPAFGGVLVVAAVVTLAAAALAAVRRAS